MQSNEKLIVNNLGLVIRRSVIDASKDLTDAEFRELINVLYHYAVYGEEIEIQSAIGNVIFNMERSFLDTNREKFISRAAAKNNFQN